MSANDFWIVIPKIYNTGDSGKYTEIYIASPYATTIHIRGSRFTPVDRKLKPMEQFIFRVETQDTSKSMEVFREWLALAKPKAQPDGLRRPLWFARAVRPSAKAYYKK